MILKGYINKKNKCFEFRTHINYCYIYITLIGKPPLLYSVDSAAVGLGLRRLRL